MIDEWDEWIDVLSRMARAANDRKLREYLQMAKRRAEMIKNGGKR